MHSFFQDIRFAIRVLVKGYGLTLIAVITLALGIGANTAVFSLVDALLFKPLPLPQPDRIVYIFNSNPQVGSDQIRVTSGDFLDWKAQSSSFEKMGLMRSGTANLAGVDRPEEISITYAQAGTMEILSHAARGRLFSIEEELPGNDRVLLLTDRFWKNRYGSDPEVLGREVTINSETYEVIGILPPELSMMWNLVDVWMPLALKSDEIDRTTHEYFAMARLKPGISNRSAQTEMDGIEARLAAEYPDTSGKWGINVMSIRDTFIGRESQLAFFFLLFAVAFVLLIACTNVANLLLAKSSARQREMAVRSALGAGRWRIVRQLVSESFVLALLGAVVGVLLAIWGLDVFVANLPEFINMKEGIRVSQRSLLFTGGATVIAALLFGITPALRASRVNLVDSLKESSQSTSDSGSKRRGRDVLVIGQIAMAMALVICTGLMVRSFLFAMNIEGGFNKDDIITMRVSLPEYAYGEESDQLAFFRDVVRNVREIPGVEAASTGIGSPFDGMPQTRLQVEGFQENEDAVDIFTYFNKIDTGYFETFEIPLIDGRTFNEFDQKEDSDAVIVSDALALRFWPEESALGKRIRLGASEEWSTIIGVVPSTVLILDDLKKELEAYRPLATKPNRTLTVFARTMGDPRDVIAPLQQAVWSIDSSLPVAEAATMEDILKRYLGAYSTFVGLLMALAGIALTLSCVGLYGVIAYSVQLRTREMGIRMALGAKDRDVLRLVLLRGVIITLAGVLIGIILATLLSKLLASVMIGVSPTDPVTYLGIGAALILVALCASYIPARRATKIDPMVALRYE